MIPAAEMSAVQVGTRVLMSLIRLLMLVLTVVAHAALAQASASPSGWGLEQLMAGMQTVRGATARFVQQKFVHMLNQPLQSSGRLIYVAPGWLQQETLEPVRSSLTVSGDELTVQQPGGQTRQLALSEIPELGALIASIRATLAGDTATLQRFYIPTLTGGLNGWVLQLRPRDPQLSKLLTMVRIEGERTSIHAIDTIERDGDRTDMTIVPDPGLTPER